MGKKSPEKKVHLTYALIHFLFLVAGITSLLIFFRKLNTYHKVIEDKNAELIGINASRDKLMSIIAHDLRSPFNTIIGLSDFLVEEASAEGNESIALQAKTIRSASARTYDLLENLLDWAQVQQGTITFKPVPTNIQLLTENEISVLQHSANKKEIILANEIPENFIVLADEHMLSTIIRNLVSNAIKFSHRGGKIRIAAICSENQAHISIADQGIGMSAEDLSTLFQINTNFTTPGTENERGTGLGLTLCYDFAKQHDGTIQVESEIGKGSTFIVILPYKC